MTWKKQIAFNCSKTAILFLINKTYNYELKLNLKNIHE